MYVGRSEVPEAGEEDKETDPPPPNRSDAMLFPFSEVGDDIETTAAAELRRGNPFL